MASFFNNILSAIRSQPPAQDNVFGRIIAGLGNDPSQIPDLGPVSSSQGMTMADAGPAPTIAPQAPGRPRRSVLDMIGGLADTIATVGGATPLYQQNLDAQLARTNAAEDRARDIDLDGLRKQLLENQVAAGGQNLEAGQLDIQNARNQLLDSAGNGLRQVFGRVGADGLAKAWPLIAGQLGIPEEQAAQIGQSLAADPQGTLDALFPVQAPANGGSQAKEAQIFALLKSQGSEEMAKAYLQSLTNPDALTPYQMQQLALAREKFGFEQDKYYNPRPTAQERSATAKQDAAAAERADGAAALGQTLDELSSAYGQLKSMGAMVDPKQGTGTNIAARLRSSGVGQLVEGAVGTDAQVQRDIINGIRPGLMQQLAKATGMSSKQLDSNADVKLFMQTVSDPTASYEANMRAVERIRRLMANPPRQSTPRPNNAPAPRQRGAAPRTLSLIHI